MEGEMLIQEIKIRTHGWHMHAQWQQHAAMGACFISQINECGQINECEMN